MELELSVELKTHPDFKEWEVKLKLPINAILNF